jgi:lipoprotein-releasing system permease protein
MGKKKNNSIRWLALKYLRGRSQGWIGSAHYLTLAGILLGVTALVCVSSVMNGFRADIRGRIIGTLSEIRISDPGDQALKDYQHVMKQLQEQGMESAPVIRNELLLKRGNAIAPTVSFGIDPDRQVRISRVLRPPAPEGGDGAIGLLAGSVADPRFPEGGIALGAGLAAKLNAGLGDEIQVLSPLFDLPTAFGMIPRVRRLTLMAVFSAGMPEYDETFSYMPLDTARFFSGYTDEVDYLELKTANLDRSEAQARRLRSRLPAYKVEDWSAYDSSLYGAIRFEKYMMFVIMLFMYIIASFNLTGNMLKAIVQKKRELGLLKAIGYQESDLRNLFLVQSLILSTIGIAGGLLLSSVLLFLQQRFGLVKLGMGDAGLMVMPVRIMATDYAMVVLVSYAITMLSVLLPLRRLKRINPVELIRQTA